MIATPDLEKMIGAEAVDPHDERIGKVSQVYVDAESDRATWVSVRTGLFGLSESVVPLTNAIWDDDVLHVAVEKAQVKDAPRIEPEAEITPVEQERLYRYYGLVAGDDPEGDADGYDATTMSETGYGAGAGLDLGIDGPGTDTRPVAPDRNDELGGERRGGRLRRYVLRQETVMVPVDDAGEPLAGDPGADDASTGMRMDDQDPRDPGLR